MRFVSAIVLLAAATTAVADPRTDFHAQIHALYDFAPHSLQPAQREQKSKQLDSFWAQMKADPTKQLPMLRAELRDPSNSAFFFFDGSQLLLRLSTSRDDRELALHSMARCELIDIDSTEYLLAVHRLGSEGLDTTEAALHVLDYPDFKAYIPQHVLTLGQDYALVYLLFSMPESTFGQALADRLGTTRAPSAQKNILLALWYCATIQGRHAIQAFIDDPRSPSESSAFAAVLMKSSSPALWKSGASAQALRDKRVDIMRRPVSDEALIEFDRTTAAIMGVKTP